MSMTAKARADVPSDDFAGPHDSFPINSQEHVDAAAKLIGHAEDPEAVKRNIMRIAKKKGFKIPDTWMDKKDDAHMSDTEFVDREGKVFEFGAYPDKKFSLTAAKYLEKNPGAGADVPIDLQHFQQAHPLTGKLGKVLKTWVQGNALFAKIRWPKSLDSLLGDDRKVSCHFSAEGVLKQIDLVTNPRIKDAFLFGGAVPSLDEPSETEFVAPDTVFEVQGMKPIGGGPGDAVPGLKPRDHAMLVAQDMHDISANCYPDLCYGGAMFSKGDSHAKAHMRMAHTKSMSHGATCKGMAYGKFSQGGTMAGQDQDDVTLSAPTDREKALLKRVAELEEKDRKDTQKGILRDAALFAESLIRPDLQGKIKALPSERAHLVKCYVAAALDDNDTPRDATFSVGEGDKSVTFSGTRLGDFIALQSARSSVFFAGARSTDGKTPPPNITASFSGEDHVERDPAPDKIPAERQAKLRQLAGLN